MAKTFALAGLRLGWIVCKDPVVMEEMKRFKDYLTICSPSTSEVLTLIALRNKSKLIQHNLDKIITNIRLLQPSVIIIAGTCIFRLPMQAARLL